MVTTYEFIKGLNETKNKTDYYNNYIDTTYIDFEEKDARCKNIVEKTMFKELDGKKIFVKQTNLAWFFFRVELVNAYMNIKLGEGPEQLFDMNRLLQIGFFEELETLIPDISSFKEMLIREMNDVEDREKDLISYIDTKLATLLYVSNSMSDAIELLTNKNELEIEE